VIHLPSPLRLFDSSSISDRARLRRRSRPPGLRRDHWNHGGGH